MNQFNRKSLICSLSQCFIILLLTNYHVVDIPCIGSYSPVTHEVFSGHKDFLCRKGFHIHSLFADYFSKWTEVRTSSSKSCEYIQAFFEKQILGEIRAGIVRSTSGRFLDGAAENIRAPDWVCVSAEGLPGKAGKCSAWLALVMECQILASQILLSCSWKLHKTGC